MRVILKEWGTIFLVLLEPIGLLIFLTFEGYIELREGNICAFLAVIGSVMAVIGPSYIRGEYRSLVKDVILDIEERHEIRIEDIIHDIRDIEISKIN